MPPSSAVPWLRSVQRAWMDATRLVLGSLQLVASGAVAILEVVGTGGSPWHDEALRAGDTAVLIAFGLRAILRLWRWRGVRREAALWLTALAVLALSAWSLRLAAALAIVHDGYRALSWFSERRRRDSLLVGVGQHPARSLVLSFAGLIGVGAFLLSLPAAGAVPIAGIDAFFTAVSAVCVTGLASVDTATAWTPFGLMVVIGLVQLGGIGIMSLTAFMTLAVGGELTLSRDAILRGAFDEPDAEELRALVKGIVLSTLAIEAIGALVLLSRFASLMPFDEAVAQAVFHAVSSFCNAGFSPLPLGLVRFAEDPVVSGTVMVLVLLGGFGFGVLVGLGRLVVSRRRLNEHARLVLVTSAVLVWVGALGFFLLEYDRSLAPLGLFGKLLASLFQSVSARTAGFNTVPIEAIGPATVLLLMALMFVGASPGSTGGGIKTTTFAVVVLTVRALVLERDDVEVFGRRMPRQLLVRALGLTAGAAFMLFGGLAVLLVSEPIGFAELAFEAASALGTVGLSMGVTGKLSVFGKLVVCILMFVGRVGPLTALSAAASRRRTPPALRLAEGRVMVG